MHTSASRDLLLCLAVSLSSALPSKHLHKRAAAGPWFNDFADPGLIFVSDDDGSRFYAYATNAGDPDQPFFHIPVATAVSIGGPWDYVRDDAGAQIDALPKLPAWYTANCGQTWAPDVVQIVGAP